MVVFYDGGCGLCHRFVAFCVRRDRAGALRFAPLDGSTFAALPAGLRDERADSLALRTADGRLLRRSRAVAAALAAIGGIWRLPGFLLRCVPRPLADLGYDLVARIRHRFFARPAQACPILPPELRGRFLP